MTAQIIDGKKTAAELRTRLRDEVVEFERKTGVTPGLATILVGENPASQVYIRNKLKSTTECGMRSFHHDLPATTSQKDLLDLIAKLNADANVHGILVQLPLPEIINERAVLEAIDPAKDVDGFHPANMGALVTGQEGLVPCTPLGVMCLLEIYKIDMAGKNAVVLGRSNIVGKPAALLLLQKNATVTIAHSRTKNLPQIISQADILVAAVGRANFVQGDWIKEGAVVIDVGINRLENGKLCGDVDFDAAQKRAAWITPVPGGVGPMTIALLLSNTLRATKLQLAKKGAR